MHRLLEKHGWEYSHLTSDAVMSGQHSRMDRRKLPEQTPMSEADVLEAGRTAAQVAENILRVCGLMAVSRIAAGENIERIS